jgi:hypothetical protein
MYIDRKDKTDIHQFDVAKRVKPVSNLIDAFGELFIVTEFCHTLDDKMLFIIHQYNGIDKPYGILGFALEKDKIKEYFELYKTFEQVRDESREFYKGE